MKIDTQLYNAFLQEMDALETFRMAYASMHPGVPLDRDDPDIRRLIEAMAVFSARTRLAGTKHINAMHRRMFQQYFPYLLTPLPATALIQAIPSGQLAEPVFLPMGSEFIVTPESGGSAFFRTMRDLRILPIQLREYKRLEMPDKCIRLALRFGAAFSRDDDIGTLSFFINHLNNFESSHLVMFQLQRCLKRVSVVFDTKASETSGGDACRVSFGATDENSTAFSHPMERERLFFHFPQSELFLNVRIPQPETDWTHFSICFDLDARWPRNLMLDPSIFQLFTVPIENIREAPAEPLIYDGTKEAISLSHPDLNYGFEPHSIKSVHEVTPQGMKTMKPGLLSGSTGSYEYISTINHQGQKTRGLHLHFPEAFENARTIVANAHWHQPWFSETISQKLIPAPFNRNIIGLKWEFPIEAIPQCDSYFQDNIEDFLQFITLINRTAFDRDNLLDILRVMGIQAGSPFRPLCKLLSDLKIEKAARTDDGEAVMLHRYLLRFETHDASLDPLMGPFLQHLENILDALVSGAKVEVRQNMDHTLSGHTERMHNEK